MMIKIVHDNQTHLKSFCFLSHADFSLYQGRDCESTILRMELILSDCSYRGLLLGEQHNSLGPLAEHRPCPPIMNKGACEGKRADVGWSECQQRASALCALSCCLFAAASPPVFLPASAFLLLNLSPENNAHVVVILPEHTCFMMWHFIPVKIQIKVQCLFFKLLKYQ